MNNSLFEEFANEYKNLKKQINEVQKEKKKKRNKADLDKLDKLLQLAKKEILNQELNPSPKLVEKINSLSARLKEPIKIAVVGQFSSGKSTFLNALLGRDILPSGIIPVTSRAIYLRYSDSYKLHITYKDKRQEIVNINQLDSFINKKQGNEDIDFVVVFAPLLILKHITFIDTPGLNSQSKQDSLITKNILNEVDGIIWLTLIDNAMKKSEEEVLSKLLNFYRGKSICVLNQKDRINNIQIKDSINYVKSNFKHFFSQVIAISAKDALEGRKNHKSIIIEDILASNMADIKNIFLEPKPQYDDLKNIYDRHLERIENIKEDNDNTKLQSSNIYKVIDFIENEIAPKSEHLKEYAITKELERLSNILAQEDRLAIDIYDKYIISIKNMRDNVASRVEDIANKSQDKLSQSYQKIELLLQSMAYEVVEDIKDTKEIRYFEVKKVFKTNIQKQEFAFYKIEHNKIINNINSKNSKTYKIFNKYKSCMQEVLEYILDTLQDMYNEFQDNIVALKHKYTIENDINKYQNYLYFISLEDILKTYIAKPYVNILREHNGSLTKSIELIKAKFELTKNQINSSYKNALMQSLNTLEQEREQNKYGYIKNPNQFPINKPTLQEITNQIYQNFDTVNIKNKIQGRNSFLHSALSELEENFVKSSNNSLELIEKEKEIFRKHLGSLETFKS